MKHRLLFIGAFIAALVVLLFFLFFISPDELPLFALFVPFMAIFVMSYLAIRAVANKFLKNLSEQAQRWFTVSVAALPVVLLILQSSGQMSSNDMWLFGLLAVLLFFYLRKADFLK